MGAPVNSCSCWSALIQFRPGHWSLQLLEEEKYIHASWVGVYEELLLSCLRLTTCTLLMGTNTISPNIQVCLCGRGLPCPSPKASHST